MTARKFFGTDGIRGVAGEYPLDPETVVRLGKALAKVLLKRSGRQRVLIGKDTRLSGYMLETSLCAGLTAAGAEVLLCGPIPTPGIAYLTKSMRAEAGIVISASHNPYADNGIKIFGADGYKLPDALEIEVESLLLGTTPLAGAASDAIGKATRIDDAVGRYTVYLKNTFPRELSLEGMRIGLDAANGAGYIVGRQVLQELGAEVVAIGVSPNGKNINDDCGSQYPAKLGEVVRQEKLAIGICLDGDGDRCVMVDERGVAHDGDTILALCALEKKANNCLPGNAIVSTVMANVGLLKLCAAQGITVHTAAVGDRHVLEMMKARGAVLGGEQSGHTIFLDESTTGDGLLTALHVMEIVCRHQKKLSELAAGFTRYPQVLINVPVRSKPPLETVAGFADLLQRKERELGSEGRILVRYSGTESKARVMVEAADESICRQHAQELAEALRTSLGT